MDNAYVYLGIIVQDAFKNIDFAIDLYTKSIELTPDDSLSFERRGFCRLGKKDLENALADLKKSGEMGGYHPDLGEIIIDIENRLKGFKGNSKFNHFYG